MIRLKIVEGDDPVKLTVLKSRFNRLATQINRMARIKPEEDQKKLYDGLKALEEQMNSFQK